MTSMMANDSQDVEVLRERTRVLEDVLGEACQFESFLPIEAHDCNKVHDLRARLDQVRHVIDAA